MNILLFVTLNGEKEKKEKKMLKNQIKSRRRNKYETWTPYFFGTLNGKKEKTIMGRKFAEKTNEDHRQKTRFKDTRCSQRVKQNNSGTWESEVHKKIKKRKEKQRERKKKVTKRFCNITSFILNHFCEDYKIEVQGEKMNDWKYYLWFSLKFKFPNGKKRGENETGDPHHLCHYHHNHHHQ